MAFKPVRSSDSGFPRSISGTGLRVGVPLEFERHLRACLEPSFRRHRLTWQERTLMAGILAGLKNRELADWTGWTEDTVESYCKDLYRKLAIHTRGQASQRIIGDLLEPLHASEAIADAVLAGAVQDPAGRRRACPECSSSRCCTKCPIYSSRSRSPG